MRQLSLFGTRKESTGPARRPSVTRLASRRALKWATFALAGGSAVAAAIWVVQPGTLASVGEDIQASFVSVTAGAGMTVDRIETSGYQAKLGRGDPLGRRSRNRNTHLRGRSRRRT